MPELQFKGKEFVYNHHLTVPFRPLEMHADKGIGAPALDGNLIIHGDNLHALKALLPTHAGKVDCIFIDPPYNTGKEGWAYSDNVNSPMIREWLSANPIGVDDGLRHDKWACMMWPRLKLLFDLLADKGVIAICIGDDEIHRLRSVLDELSEVGFLGVLTWKSRAKPHNTGSAKLAPQRDTEYVLLYGNRSTPNFNLVVSGETRSYPHEDADGRFRLQTILKSDRGENKRDTMKFDVDGYVPPAGQRWQGGKDSTRDLFKRNRAGFFEGTPFLKYYEHEEPDESSPFWCYVPRGESGTSEDGKNLLNAILGNDHGLDTVKPLGIINYTLKRLDKPDAIILDSFAGSGTTAHAVLAANARDGGNRRFILVEGEDYADTLTAERTRRVVNGYSFSGTQREELLREPLTYSKLRNANALLESVQRIETLDGPKYDRIVKTVKDGALIVTGEHDVAETTPGLGGEFTYCTLGAPVEMDAILSGEALPTREAIASLLWHTATAHPFDAKNMVDAPDIGEGVAKLGSDGGRTFWLIYRNDRDWLKTGEAALSLSKARSIAATAHGNHLVFAPAKFVSRELLARERINVDYAPLPFALYRLETA